MLALQGRFVWWAVGECLLAVALVQWFVLLHECGHAHALCQPAAQCRGWASRRLLRAHPVSRVDPGSRPPSQVDRLAGPGSDDGDAGAAGARGARTSRRERVLAVLDPAVLGDLPARQLLESATPHAVVSQPRRASPTRLQRGWRWRPATSPWLSSLGPLALLRVVRSRGPGRLRHRGRAAHQPAHAHPDGASQRARRAAASGPSTRKCSPARCACPRAMSCACPSHFDAHELHHMYPFVPGYRLDAGRRTRRPTR